MQKAREASVPDSQTGHENFIQDLTSAASILQTLIENADSDLGGSIRSIPLLLRQAHENLLDLETRLQQNEIKLKETQRIFQEFRELQTLVEILPVGILIAHDAQNRDMTINLAGARMLNLSPGINPSKSAPDSEQLPFKILHAGQEVPAEELPMQFAAAKDVALHDIELEVQQANGNLLNLLEYASPLYDEHGNVRGSLGVFVDITAQKSVERRLAMQYQIAQALAESNNINNAAAQVLQMICETTGWEYGTLWQVESDGLLTNKGVWHAQNVELDEYAKAVRYSSLNGQDNMPGQVIQQGQSLWIGSLAEIRSDDANEACEAGLQSGFILPVRNRDKVIAILECLSLRSQIQDPNLVAMLNAVCQQIGLFLERKLLEEALVTRANQQNLLAEAGIALSTSPDYENRLQAILHLIVPDLADWCAIDLIDSDNILRRVAAVHVDPDKEKLIYEIQPTRSVNFSQTNRPQIETLLTGQSLLYSDVSFSLIESMAYDPKQLEIIRRLNPRSSIVVPLIAHGRIFGICTFAQSDSGRRYLPSDLAFAEGIVRQVAVALDNAILYSESQRHNIELERRVDERTSQLKIAIEQLTNQIVERQHAEDEVKILNSELELRIAERTAQLERANQELNKEVLDRQKASQALGILLMRTRELYRISQSIGTVRTPNELLKLLLSSSYLKDANRASIVILEKPWIEVEAPPERCTIIAEWNRGVRQPKFINQHFTLEEYGIALPVPYGQPVLIQDIQSVSKLSERIRKRFASLGTHSLIILPLIAGGEWYGLLSLHFKDKRVPHLDDLRHVRGLVDETAIVIKNMRLLDAESQARQEAETANDLKLKFLAMVSHELRTPLASIKGFATTLLAEDVVWPPEKQIDFLQIINRESDKLGDLIEQLLDLTRLEAGVLRIIPKKVSLQNILESALAQLQALTTDHKLLLDLPPGLPAILCDAQRIAQVLTNLVGNAAKFSQPETLIIITAHQTGEMVQVDVVDQGPGIPSQNRARVFESFRQLEDGSDNQKKGAGLGLAICKGIIESQNGKIWIQDHPGPGTVISFTLPVYRETKNDTAN